MTEEDIRAWLASLCEHCSILGSRHVAECHCSFCGSRCCSIHRSIYGETIVCSSCWYDIKDGRRAISPELHALMESSAAKVHECLQQAGELVARWIEEGMTEEQALERFWGKDLINKWRQLDP